MNKLLASMGVAALLALAGCGGSSHHGIENNGPGGPTTPPVGMVDSFFNAVLALIGDGAETTTEPVATDAVVATAPDDTEPVAVK